VNGCESAFSNILCATPVQPGQQVTVPDVTGQSQASAETAIVAVDLVVGTVDTEFSEVEAGLVISQDPAGGTLVPRDSEVNLLVSLGPALDCSQHDGRPLVPVAQEDPDLPEPVTARDEVILRP
jgi:hypothetical protein